MRLIDADVLKRKAQEVAVESWKMKIKASVETILNQFIDAAPTIESEQKWIPVSERLPDLDKYNHGKIWEQEVLITGYFSFDDEKELFISEKFASDVAHGSVNDIVVTAWMPLPKPWRG